MDVRAMLEPVPPSDTLFIIPCHFTVVIYKHILHYMNSTVNNP